MVMLPIAVAVLSGVIFVVLLHKLMQRSVSEVLEDCTGTSDEGWSEEWFEEFSAFRYLPMRRLIAPEEEAFFQSNLAEGSKTLAQFRAERRAIFRQYLSFVRADFARLREGVRLSILHSKQEKSAQLEALLRTEMTFRRLLFVAELRLTLHWLGVKPMEPARLINAMQGLEYTLREVRLSA